MAIAHAHNEKRAPSGENAGLLPAWVNPDLDRLMVVKNAKGDFRSWSESLVDLPAGAVFARITGVTSVWPPSWSSVQVRVLYPFNTAYGRYIRSANVNIGRN